MTEAPDDLEKLLADVRKTITDNRQFLEKLLDETTQDDSNDEQEESETEAVTAEEEFEEL